MAHILIVEDENATAWALAESLREEGYETRHAASAEDALAALRAHATDLVITDLRLPGMNGAATEAALRMKAGETRRSGGTGRPCATKNVRTCSMRSSIRGASSGPAHKWKTRPAVFGCSVEIRSACAT